MSVKKLKSTHQNPAGASLTRYEFAGPIFCLGHKVPVRETSIWVLALVTMVMVVLYDVDESGGCNKNYEVGI